MNDKKASRLRRARRSRAKIKELKIARLCINRTPRHIYAQIIDGAGDKVLASASTVEKDLKSGATSNAAAAEKVGSLIAERAKAAGIEKVAFDRSGFKFHGRVKSLAEAARAAGLDF